jgi:hypothetical protein
VLFPDGSTKAVYRFPYRVQSLFLHQFRVGMYCFRKQPAGVFQPGDGAHGMAGRARSIPHDAGAHVQ